MVKCEKLSSSLAHRATTDLVFATYSESEQNESPWLDVPIGNTSLISVPARKRFP